VIGRRDDSEAAHLSVRLSKPISAASATASGCT